MAQGVSVSPLRTGRTQHSFEKNVKKEIPQRVSFSYGHRFNAMVPNNSGAKTKSTHGYEIGVDLVIAARVLAVVAAELKRQTPGAEDAVAIRSRRRRLFLFTQGSKPVGTVLQSEADPACGSAHARKQTPTIHAPRRDPVSVRKSHVLPLPALP